ncbi:hypothetical protein [Streptomyces sp. NPDC059783]|uniref:hypothetical protein n=1 Tax=Streptomyces sp. NPDC059783 TaxID=3346944 RepID=UPI0036490AB9
MREYGDDASFETTADAVRAELYGERPPGNDTPSEAAADTDRATPDSTHPAGNYTLSETTADAVRAALDGGRLAEARLRAEAALKVYGVAAVLYELLGRAHAAEDEDDHDDEAERAYRRGLEHFPDDLDLLVAYAELCLRSDPLDHPGRSARGPALADRIIALAPDSVQALHVGRYARGEIMAVPPGGSLPPGALAHIQRHDVRTALADAPDVTTAARLAWERAADSPYDLRLAIRADTLLALDRPGHRLLRFPARAPMTALWAVTVLVAAFLVTRAAFHWPVWTGVAVLLLSAPTVLLARLEHRSRALATARTPVLPPDTPLPDSPLPPPPAYSSRESVSRLAAGALVLCAAASPLLWPAPQNTDYPHYVATPPPTLLGAPLLTAVPSVDGTDPDTVTTESDDFGPGNFMYAYGTPESLVTAEPVALVMGMTGDYHGADPDSVRVYERDLSESESTIDDVWNAPPGPHGGRLRCVAYSTDAEDDGAHSACTWLDRGSYGTVVLNKPSLDRETAAAIARTTRDAVLREDTSGSTPA